MLGFFRYVGFSSMEQNNHIHAFTQYLLVEKRSSQLTIEAYRKELTRWEAFIRHEFDQDLLTANRDATKRFVVWRGKSGASPRSINRTLSALRTFYRWCERTNRSANHPMKGIRSLKMEKKVVMSIPESDLRDMIKSDGFDSSFEGARDQLILLLLYGLGLRRAELIDLRLNNFDWDRNVVTVTGKRQKTRQVPVPNVIQEYFDRYINFRSKLAPLCDELLVTPKGKKLYPSLVYKIVVHYLKGTTSVVDKYPHALRHSYATHLLNSGVDINTVKELMGHESLSSTQVYTTSTFEELVQAYNQAHPKGS